MEIYSCCRMKASRLTAWIHCSRDVIGRHLDTHVVVMVPYLVARGEFASANLDYLVIPGWASDHRIVHFPD